MSTTLDHRLAVRGEDQSGVTLPRVLRSEWTKFRSLRSSMWVMAVAIVLTVGVGAIVSAVQSNNYASLDAAQKAAFDPISNSLAGMNFAELAVGVLGILVMTGEYGTGMIRSSLTVVPQRLPVLWGKLVVTAATTFIVMCAASFGAFFLGQALLGDAGTTLGADSALRSVLGAALAVTVVAVLGLGLGGIARNTAAAISGFVAVMFVVPPLMNLLPGAWNDAISPYLPSNAAGSVFGGLTGNSLGPWTGFAVLCAYAAALVGVAACNLRRRDA